MPIPHCPFRTHQHFSASSLFLPVRIHNPDFKGEHFDTNALVDTGSDSSAIPDYIAKALAHRVTDVNPEDGYGANGNLIIFPHTFRIDIFSVDPIGTIDYDDIAHPIPKQEIGVIPGLKYVLLGVAGFLEDFKLFVDYPNRVFSITRKNPFAKRPQAH